MSHAFVVIPRLQNHEVLFINEVNQPMFLVNASRPAPSEEMAERFRLTNSLKGVPKYIVEEPVQSLKRRPISCAPKDGVLPPIWGEDHPHQ